MAKKKKIKKVAAGVAIAESYSANNGGLISHHPPVARARPPLVINSRRNPFLLHAAVLLVIATFVSILFVGAALNLEGGKAAIQTIGGLQDAEVPLISAKVVLFLDTLFPLFYGGGLAVFAASFQSRTNRSLIRLILTAILIAVSADFFENALAYSVMKGDEPYLLRWPLTVIKYGSLAFSAVALSAIMPVVGVLGKLVHFLVRYLFPVAIALLVSGLGGDVVADLVGLSFPISLLLLAIYARELVDKKN
ncbi:MAG: hypothetical protein ACR2O3_14300 [Rhizobiaceae bacterium]